MAFLEKRVLENISLIFLPGHFLYPYQNSGCPNLKTPTTVTKPLPDY
jgi:hypothetical protein